MPLSLPRIRVPRWLAQRWDRMGRAEARTEAAERALRNYIVLAPYASRRPRPALPPAPLPVPLQRALQTARSQKTTLDPRRVAADDRLVEQVRRGRAPADDVAARWLAQWRDDTRRGAPGGT